MKNTPPPLLYPIPPCMYVLYLLYCTILAVLLSFLTVCWSSLRTHSYIHTDGLGIWRAGKPLPPSTPYIVGIGNIVCGGTIHLIQ